MKPAELEVLESVVMSMVVQAFKDYWVESVEIFSADTNHPQRIAEDITRDAINAMGLPGIHERLYGKFVLKKAIYAFLPTKAIPVALMLDAKADKSNGNTTAPIQIEQTSMRVRLSNSDREQDEQGKSQTIIKGKLNEYQTVTIIAQFCYSEKDDKRSLDEIIVRCIPNGELQEIYNPDATDTIWLVGDDAPSLGDEFQVKLSYKKLNPKTNWRVAKINQSCSCIV